VVSIIIVSYNVKYYIEQCLRSISKASNNVDVEVFVVDNNSNDGTVEYLSPRFPDVEFIQNSENVGFGRANNIALSKSKGDYVLFLNPDTIISEKTLEECTCFMDSHESAGSVGVRMLHSNGRFAPESRRSIPTPFVAFCKMSGLSRLFPKSRLLARYHMSYIDNSAEAEIEVVSGAFMFVRHDILKRIGGFDEDFFMYGEDIDLSYRLLKEGYSNWYIPVPILHYKGESTVKTSYRYVRVFYDAMIIFFNKHFKHYSRIFSFFIMIVLGVKKIFSYLRYNLIAGQNKIVGTDMDNFLFIGEKDSFEKVRSILERYYPEGLKSLVEGDEMSMPKGHLSMDISNFDYVIYDVDLFSYDLIFRTMSLTACNNLKLGTFCKGTGLIITEQKVML
jgi:N-acetylglucosaminyl-diphospho-decaprenol L-rhamnosyltransferase